MEFYSRWSVVRSPSRVEGAEEQLWKVTLKWSRRRTVWCRASPPILVSGSDGRSQTTRQIVLGIMLVLVRQSRCFHCHFPSFFVLYSGILCYLFIYLFLCVYVGCIFCVEYICLSVCLSVCLCLYLSLPTYIFLPSFIFLLHFLPLIFFPLLFFLSSVSSFLSLTPIFLPPTHFS